MPGCGFADSQLMHEVARAISRGWVRDWKPLENLPRPAAPTQVRRGFHVAPHGPFSAAVSRRWTTDNAGALPVDHLPGPM